MSGNRDDSPGSCNIAELAAYWRVDRGEAPRIAKRLGLRARAGRYPWLSIWKAMGIGAPSAEQIEELKAPLMTLSELAVQRAESVGTVRRKLREGRLSDLPHHAFGPRTKRFHPAQALAWCDGEDIPRYPKLAEGAPAEARPASSEATAPPKGARGKRDLMGRPI